MNTLDLNLLLRLRDAEKIGCQFSFPHEVEGGSAFGHAFDATDFMQVHVVEAPIAGVLEKGVADDSRPMGCATQSALVVGNLGANADAFDTVCLLQAEAARLGPTDKIGLRPGNLRLLGVAVHRGKVTGKPGELIVGRRFAINSALFLDNILEDGNVEAGQCDHGALDCLAEGMEALVTQHDCQFRRPPEAEAVLVPHRLKARLLGFQMERALAARFRRIIHARESVTMRALMEELICGEGSIRGRFILWPEAARWPEGCHATGRKGWADIRGYRHPPG